MRSPLFRFPGKVLRWLRLAWRMALLTHPRGPYHRECARYAREILASVEVSDPGFFDSHIYRKMIWYMVENLWLAREMHQVHGLSLSVADRQRYALGAPLFAVADFLIDDTEEPLAAIRAFVQNPDAVHDFPYCEVFRAFHHAFLNALGPALPRDQILAYYFRLHEAQFASRGQKDAHATPEQIDQWVRDKIGIGFQMVRTMVPKALVPGEMDAWYELGALTQYCNDIQDLHKDLQGGVRNFASTQPSLSAAKAALRQQQARTYAAMEGVAVVPARWASLRYQYEAFVLVMEAKLGWYARAVGGNYRAEVFKALPKKRAYVSPFHPYSLRHCLPALLWESRVK